MRRGDRSRHRLGLLAAAYGVVLQLVGLGLDLALHTEDPDLAAREGLLALSNPGHALFAGGLALTVAGVAAMLLASQPRRRRVIPTNASARRGLGFAVGGLSAFAAGAAVVAVIAGPFPAATDVTAGNSPRHSVADGAEAEMGLRQLRRVDRMLATAKAASMRYRDVDVARASGYVQWTDAVPAVGAHLINLELLTKDQFDVARPSTLVYDQSATGRFELVGVAWTKPRPAPRPPSPFGPLADWHTHDAGPLGCFTSAGGMLRIWTLSRAACEGAGGVLIDRAPWMLHAWVFRPGPEGFFSINNASIRGSADYFVAA